MSSLSRVHKIQINELNRICGKTKCPAEDCDEILFELAPHHARDDVSKTDLTKWYVTLSLSF